MKRSMPSADTDTRMSQSFNVVRPPDETDVHEHIAARLADEGWCVVENYLDALTVAQLRDEALGRWQEGCYHLARVGRGGTATHRPEIRRDQVMWFEPPYSGVQAAHLARMEQLRGAINRKALMGLFDFECHFTRYALGAYYKKHLDRFRNDSRRTVSVVVYLNETWDAGDGGVLRLFLCDAPEAAYRDIEPRGGTLVCFLSDRFWHEVMPTKRERLSLTGWFRTRP